MPKILLNKYVFQLFHVNFELTTLSTLNFLSAVGITHS
jgi:hypothetical protein